MFFKFSVISNTYSHVFLSNALPRYRQVADTVSKTNAVNIFPAPLVAKSDAIPIPDNTLFIFNSSYFIKLPRKIIPIPKNLTKSKNIRN
jgi:hypothetical protein